VVRRIENKKKAKEEIVYTHWMPHPTGPAPTATASASNQLRQIIAENRAGGQVGTYAVCSSHSAVIDAAVSQSLADGSLLHVESTSSQVNQFGGYSGQTPEQFAGYIRRVASKAGLGSDQVLLGADHLGPFCWRHEGSASAMIKACDLARSCVRAGYQKIHLDASMPCADDGDAVEEHVIAERAAILCAAAEQEFQKIPGSTPPLYVIGTEVPPPGGEVAVGNCPLPTKIEDVDRTLDVFRAAFHARGLEAAWENVIALVVQPGVEFGDAKVFDYDPSKGRALAEGLPPDRPLVYEAHSTDYQNPGMLAELVDSHFAILKVGPWLTFSYREAVFALSAIERETLGGKRDVSVSQVREVLDAEMLRDPRYWRTYYRGDESELRFARAYSFSDRCRYYWAIRAVQEQVALLHRNLDAYRPPLTVLSQYLPSEYEAIRSGEIENRIEAIIGYHIQSVLRTYAAACGARLARSASGRSV
jgi:D-tagatose-1,6-bisphosphate aldolase subunit GatZ/KbaZ